MFFNIEREKIKEVIIVLVLLYLVLNIVTTGIASLLKYIYIIPGLFLAISVHEFAHAYVAYKLGDITPEREGRLTLNPFAHIDPLGLVTLFVFGIGWGRPVTYNPSAIGKSAKEIEKNESLVALAGPVSNFIVAILVSFISGLTYFLGLKLGANMKIIGIILLIFYSAISINVGLGIFNLIPIPPLDGFKVFSLFLPRKYKEYVENNFYLIQIVFIISLYVGIVRMVISPIIVFLTNIIVKIGAFWV